MNTLTIVGRVGRDPEMRFTNDGKAVVTFSVATEHGRDDNKRTSWHNVVAFGSLAENIAASVSKGSRVICCGRLDVSEYEAKSGEKKKKHELIADAVGLELRWEAPQMSARTEDSF